MERKGWILVKLLMIVTGSLIFIYLITPKLQKDIYRVRDLTTQSNLEYIRTAVLAYYKDKGDWPQSLSTLIPEYLESIPNEFLSSSKGSNKVINAEMYVHFNNLRTPQAQGWIYGSYDAENSDNFAHMVLPMSSVLSDKSGSTSSW